METMTASVVKAQQMVVFIKKFPVLHVALKAPAKAHINAQAPKKM